MIIEIRLNDLIHRDWHSWLDNNSPGWSYSNALWEHDGKWTQAFDNISNVSDEYLDAIQEQLNFWDNIGDATNFWIQYQVKDRDVAMLSRLVWGASPARLHAI